MTPASGFNDYTKYRFRFDGNIIFEGVLHTDPLKGWAAEALKVKKSATMLLEIEDANGKLILKKKLNSGYRNILLIKNKNIWTLQYTNNPVRWD